MAESSQQDRNVGIFGANIFDNENLARKLASNANAMNANLNKSNTQSEKQPGFFEKIKNRFQRSCDCPCDKKESKASSNASPNVNVNVNVSKSNTTTLLPNKNCIRLFNSLGNEKGQVLLVIKVSDKSNTNIEADTGNAEGGDLKSSLLKLKKNIPQVSDVTKQIKDIAERGKGKGMFGVLKNAYKNKKEITNALKKGNPNAIIQSIEKATGVNVNNVSQAIKANVNTKRESNSINKTKNVSNGAKQPHNANNTNTKNVKTNVERNTTEQLQNAKDIKSNGANANSNSNVSNKEPVLFALRVEKTQTNSKRNIPASILSILDYLVTNKGIELSKVKSLDDMVSGILSLFAIGEPQSLADIFKQCDKVFGNLTSIDGIKSLCMDNSIIRFEKAMNEWDVLRILYNEFLGISEQSAIDIGFFKTLLGKIKEECGNVQSINLAKINKYFKNRLKLFIEDQCNNIEALSTKEMESIKKSFVDNVCSKDDKYTELASFLVIYFNFFLNELLSQSNEEPYISTILEQQLHFNVNILNTTNKNIRLYVKKETLTEFLEKFSSDKIIINL